MPAGDYRDLSRHSRGPLLSHNDMRRAIRGDTTSPVFFTVGNEPGAAVSAQKNTPRGECFHIRTADGELRVGAVTLPIIEKEETKYGLH